MLRVTQLEAVKLGFQLYFLLQTSDQELVAHG